jgi:hypothetical protein
MQATNGSLRSRSRLVGVCLAVVVALSAIFASAANAAPTKETTLALGDSLAFGYSSQLFNENALAGDPATAFEHGYINYYQIIHKYKANGIALVNNGCPGETTDSLIGNGPLAKAVDPTGEAPCAYHNLLGAPLHNEYGGAGVSQLESALGVIAINAAKSTPVTTITLNIGANDELHAIAKCKAEVQSEYEKTGKSIYGPTPEAAVKGCIEFHVEELFTHIITNIGRISFVLHNGSLFGGINWSGKLIFQGGYDPYGVVYKSAEEVANVLKAAPWFAESSIPPKTGEQLSGSLTLAKLLNFKEEEHAKEFGMCFANPFSTFNPGGVKESGGILTVGTLQKYTNMNNETRVEVPPTSGKFLNNGPDIHPTPAGYKKLAQIMTAACG